MGQLTPMRQSRGYEWGMSEGLVGDEPYRAVIDENSG